MASGSDARSFAATVTAWARKSDDRLNAIFRESSKRVVSLAQSRIPVDLGFARASVLASLSEMPMIDPAMKGLGRAVHYDPGEIVLVIAGARLGDAIYVGWTANYVGYLESGSSSQAPSGFVRVSAMEWPRIVRDVTAEARATAAVNRGIG